MPYNGYSPGNYMGTCSGCGHTMIAVQKRAVTCLTCAFGGTSPVYVFGSNLAGRHGKGAAAVAMHQYGAVDGQGRGHHGNSYALPTKDGQLRSLPLEDIQANVATFIAYATEHSELMFQVTPIGCGLAGYPFECIAPFFADAPDNCVMPFEFKGYIG